MTQEEKAKRYDEAIEKAKEYFNSPRTCFDIEQLCNVFPELKESEDERIMEKVIATIHLYYGEPLEDEAKEMIAWLEKQGEHAKFRDSIQVGDKVTRNEDGVLVNLSQLNRVAKKDEKQGEQKPADKVEPKFKVGDVIKPKDPVLGEPRIIKGIHPKFGYDTNNGILDFEFEDNWEFVEQNITWSEEDEKMKNQLVDFMLSGIGISKAPYGCVAWLKSLKNRYTWKPSGEQIVAIDTAINVLGKGTLNGKQLIELKEQLKKL